MQRHSGLFEFGRPPLPILALTHFRLELALQLSHPRRQLANLLLGLIQLPPQRRSVLLHAGHGDFGRFQPGSQFAFPLTARRQLLFQRPPLLRQLVRLVLGRRPTG